MKTRKPKEIYKRIMQSRVCETEYRKELFEALKLSMKEHYPTIFGQFSDDRLMFVFDEDASLLMKVYADDSDYDAPYQFNVWKILARIPLDEKDEWCFETFIEYMG